MAEATALRNNALPYPVYGAPYTVAFPILDADGDLVTGAASLDSEVSKNGDTFSDCTNEATEIATNSGVYYLTLTATEMTADVVSVIVKTSTSGAKTTTLVLYPRKLVTLASGTSQGGAAGYITLAAGTVLFNNQFSGCLCVATIDTVVEARILGTCTASNQQCAVAPDWVSGDPGPDSNDTYVIYLPEGMRIPESNVKAISDDATAADNAELEFDGTGYAGGTTRRKVDVDTIKTQAVTCAAGVTVRADVGAAAAPGSANGMLIGGSNAATTFSTLTSTGAFTCGSTVLGNTTMGTLTQTGAVSWGATTFASLAITGAASVGTTTTLSGAVSLGSTLTVTGATTLASLSVTGQLDAGNLLIDTTTALTGAVTAGSTVAITGAVTAPSVTLSGAFQAATIVSTGTTTLNALTVTNAATLGTLTVSGATSLQALGMTTLTASGAVALQSTVGVTGAVTLSSTLGVGAVTFASMAVTGAISVGTTTTLTGVVTATAANDIRGVKVGGYLATAITEGSAGRIAAAVTKFGDVATPVFTAASVNQTGDAIPLIGTPADLGNGTATLAGNLSDIDGEADTILATVLGIGTAGGAAFNVDATTDNVSGGISGVTSGTTFLGTQASGTYASTSNENGVYHRINGTDSTNTKFDIVYQFLTGSGTQVVQAEWVGIMNSSDDTLVFDVWRHDTNAWEAAVISVTGTNAATVQRKTIKLYSWHRGTSTAEVGKVYIRLRCTGTSTPTVYTDQLLVAYGVVTTGDYADGAVWLNTNASNTNTQYRVDGITTNPVSTIAAALTIAAAGGLKRIRVANGSSVTLGGVGATTIANYTLVGRNWTLALGGATITSAAIEGATISGIGVGTGMTFTDCQYTGTQTVGGGNYLRCGFGVTTFTMLASSAYSFVDCYDSDPDTTTSPVFVWAASAVVGARGWRGAFQNASMASTNKLTIDGTGGRVILSDTSVGGAITIRGNFPPITGGTGLHSEAEFVAHGGTVTQTQRFGTDQAMADSSGVTETLTRIPDQTAGAAGGLAIVGSKMDLLDTIMEDA